MFYKFDEANRIAVPAPFKRYMTPLFMADDPTIIGSDFSVHITEWEPGCQIDPHSHPAAMEAMYCMEGHGYATVDSKRYVFEPGCMIVAPKNVMHKIENTGTTMLRVFCVFSPAITAESLRERAMVAVNSAKA